MDTALLRSEWHNDKQEDLCLFWLLENINSPLLALNAAWGMRDPL